MRFALFASGAVGAEVARFLGDERETLSGLVLDVQDRDGRNAEIVASSRVTDPSTIFYSHELYTDHAVAALKSMDLDMILLAWWPYIVSQPIIGMPRLGCLNFHPSLLPYNRGKHYNFWAIVEEAPFGVTLHWIDEGVDSGPIAFQRAIGKSWEDTGETLYRRAQSEIVSLFKDNFPRIKAGDIPRISQALEEGSFHRSAELDPACRIHLDRCYTARDLLNIMRARTFAPHPAAYFIDGGERYEARVQIRKVELTEPEVDGRV